MFRDDGESQSATCGEVTFDAHVARMTKRQTRSSEFVLMTAFVERMNVAIRGQIKLERFGFKEQPSVGNIFYKNLSKIRLTGHRAKRREIRAINADRKIALSIWIRKRLNLAWCGDLGKAAWGCPRVSAQRIFCFLLRFFTNE